MARRANRLALAGDEGLELTLAVAADVLEQRHALILPSLNTAVAGLYLESAYGVRLVRGLERVAFVLGQPNVQRTDGVGQVLQPGGADDGSHHAGA